MGARSERFPSELRRARDGASAPRFMRPTTRLHPHRDPIRTSKTKGGVRGRPEGERTKRGNGTRHPLPSVLSLSLFLPVSQSKISHRWRDPPARFRSRKSSRVLEYSRGSSARPKRHFEADRAARETFISPSPPIPVPPGILLFFFFLSESLSLESFFFVLLTRPASKVPGRGKFLTRQNARVYKSEVTGSSLRAHREFCN